MRSRNILFVCIENSNRSQMAEAFANIHGKKVVNSYSAGSNPSGIINPKAIEAMKTIGYDLTLHKSKTVDEFRNVDLDYVITMGCGDACPFIRAKHREDWDIPDPRNFPVKNFIIIRDLIERKVKQLITKIENENANNKR